MNLKLWAIAYVLVLCGCGGCVLPQSAAKLAGYETPGFSLHSPSGWSVSASTDTKGIAEYEVSPDGSVKFRLDMSSNASDPTLAQGERALALERLREIEAARLIEQQKALNDLTLRLIDRLLPAPVPVQ